MNGVILIPPLEEGDEDVTVVVDEILQDEFFKTISNQLQSIDQFFKKEESRLEFSLSELEDQVSCVHGYMYWMSMIHVHVYS